MSSMNNDQQLDWFLELMSIRPAPKNQFTFSLAPRRSKWWAPSGIRRAITLLLTLRKMPPEDQGSKRPLLKEKEDKTSDNVSVSFLKPWYVISQVLSDVSAFTRDSQNKLFSCHMIWFRSKRPLLKEKKEIAWFLDENQILLPFPFKPRHSTSFIGAFCSWFPK